MQMASKIYSKYRQATSRGIYYTSSIYTKLGSRQTPMLSRAAQCPLGSGRGQLVPEWTLISCCAGFVTLQTKYSWPGRGGADTRKGCPLPVNKVERLAEWFLWQLQKWPQLMQVPCQGKQTGQRWSWLLSREKDSPRGAESSSSLLRQWAPQFHFYLTQFQLEVTCSGNSLSTFPIPGSCPGHSGPTLGAPAGYAGPSGDQIDSTWLQHTLRPGVHIMIPATQESPFSKKSQ